MCAAQPLHFIKNECGGIQTARKRNIEAVFSKSRLADPALRNQDSMALSDRRGNDNVHFQTAAQSEG